MERIYYELKDESSQYDDIQFTEGEEVEARYIKLPGIDSGNMYIEALPPPRNKTDIDFDFNKSIRKYSPEEIKNMSVFEKEHALTMLKELRFRLPFHARLDSLFYFTLVVSYRARKKYVSDFDSVKLVVHNKEEDSNSKLYGFSSKETTGTFSLCGASGSGKSAAISMLLERYPQVIRHNDDNNSIQIVYLVVNCLPNSNLNMLCVGIGDAIDKALGNIKPYYAEAVRRCRNLGEKMEKLRQFIEELAIGAIILDEIELMSFDRNKEASFESFMILANRTKVAIIVVGTPDGRDKMFRYLRTARRLGTSISADSYCERYKLDDKNKPVRKKIDFFKILVSEMMDYQLFDEPVEVTDEIVEAFYSVSLGMVGLLINAFEAVHYAYFKNPRLVIDAKLIKEKAFECNDRLPRLLQNERDTRIEYGVYCKETRNAWLRQIDAELEEQEVAIASGAGIQAKINMVLEKAMANIRSDKYPDYEISEAFKSLRRKHGDLTVLDMDEGTVGEELLVILKKRVKAKKKISKEVNNFVPDFLSGLCDYVEKENDNKQDSGAAG